MPEFTAEQKLSAILRELGFRIRVYDRRVEAGSMTREKAAYEIAIMTAIAEDYEKRVKEGMLPL